MQTDATGNITTPLRGWKLDSEHCASRSLPYSFTALRCPDPTVNSFFTRFLSSCTDENAQTYDISTY